MNPKPMYKLKSPLEIGDKGNDIEILQKYLNTFGYLLIEKEDSTFKNIAILGVFDSPTRAALISYQTFFGLEQTGEFDIATKKSMSIPRCGNPDVRQGRSNNFEVDGRRWNKTNLTYTITEFTSDLTQNQIRTAIHQAFDLWSNVSPLNFTEIDPNQSPDIVIRFTQGNHGDCCPFDGQFGVLAHAFFPPPNGSFAGDAHFDDAETWTVNIPNQANTFDLVTVAAHEFGHSLGLRHSSVFNSIMWPNYKGIQRHLDEDDILGITSLYPFPIWRNVATNDPAWSDGSGWKDISNYSTIQAVGVGNDLYLVARADAAMITLRYDRNTDKWVSVANNDPAWSDSSGWKDISNYSTIQAVGVGNDLYLLARADAGMITLRYDRNTDKWVSVANNDPAWSDSSGWKDISNYSTIQAVG
ncbi:matrixin family metalloprotease, partial [Aquimarina rubra]